MTDVGDVNADFVAAFLHFAKMERIVNVRAANRIDGANVEICEILSI